MKTFVGFSLGRPRRDPTKMSFYFMVQKKKILRGLIPLQSIVVVFFVPLGTLLFIINLTDKKETYFLVSLSITASHLS